MQSFRRPLADQMRRILSRYNSSLRAFMNPRKSKMILDENSSTKKIFYISSCFPADNSHMLWAWGYEINKKNHEWILFRNTCCITGSKLGTEIASGLCVKLSIPWYVLPSGRELDFHVMSIIMCNMKAI